MCRSASGRVLRYPFRAMKSHRTSAPLSRILALLFAAVFFTAFQVVAQEQQQTPLLVIISVDGMRPDYVAGHSLGEYSALVAAGALKFGDALRLVRRRGEYMQSAVPEGVGAMAAVAQH